MVDGVTPNVSLVKPEDLGSPETWGYKLNDNSDRIDAAIAELMAKSGYPVAEFGRNLSADTNMPSFGSGWATCPINPNPYYDPFSVVSIGSNQFQFNSDGGIEWEAEFFILNDQLGSYIPDARFTFVDFRLYDVTSNAVQARGFRGHHAHVHLESRFPHPPDGKDSGMSGGMMVQCSGGSRVVAGHSYRFEANYYRYNPANPADHRHTGFRFYAQYVDVTPGYNDEFVLRVQYWRD